MVQTTLMEVVVFLEPSKRLGWYQFADATPLYAFGTKTAKKRSSPNRVTISCARAASRPSRHDCIKLLMKSVYSLR